MSTLADAAKTAAELDAIDPLASFRDEFVIDEPDLVYLDGNSLGRMPRSARALLREAVDIHWGGGLVRSWESWISLTRRTGDAIAAAVLGAPPGTTVVSDSTSVNVFKLATAALAARPDRHDIVTDSNDFPTDRYLMNRVAATGGGQVRHVTSDPVDGLDVGDVLELLDDGVALVCLSHVNYRSGAIADMGAITDAAHEHGALVLWDVSHSVGAVPIDVTTTGADLVTGCTYKYLNSGPGAPAFLYVREDLIETFDAPMPGWFAQLDQFEMGPSFAAAPGIDRFQVGTPPILSTVPIAPAVDMIRRAGIEAVRAKSLSLTSLLIELADAHLAELDFAIGSPRDPRRRGGHVTLTHPMALAISVALRECKNMVGDFRMPDGIRLAPVPLYTTHADVVEAIRRIVDTVVEGHHLHVDAHPRVT